MTDRFALDEHAKMFDPNVRASKQPRSLEKTIGAE
jgi:hypothetical protein